MIEVANNIEPEIKSVKTQDNLSFKDFLVSQFSQEKFSSPEEKDKVINFFEKIQGEYPTPINDYIKKNSSNKDWLNDKKDLSDIYSSDKDSAKSIILPEIDDFFKNKPLIEVFKQTTVENQQTTVENQQTTVENQQTTEKFEQKDIENKQTTEIKQNKFEKVSDQKKLTQQRDSTLKSYENLDPKFKLTPDQILEQKKNIPANVLSQVEKKIQGTNLKLDDYINFAVTANAGGDAIKNTDFGKDFQKLNENLGFPPKSLDGLIGERGIKNADAIIQSNSNLNSFSDNAKNFDNLKSPNFLGSLDAKTLYKFLDPKVKEQLKDAAGKVKDFDKYFDHDTMTLKPDSIKDTTQVPTDVVNFANTYKNTIQTFETNFKQTTEKIIRQRIVTSAVSGLAGYFDSSNIQTGDDFSKDFALDASKDININENKSLNLKGLINGRPVGFYYDLKNESSLQADDYLHLNGQNTDEKKLDTATSGSFSVGSGKENLPIVLPSLARLSAQAEDRYNNPENSKKLLENGSFEDFQDNFKTSLSENLQKNFGAKDIVKTRIERNNQRNMASKDALDFVQKNFSPDGMTNLFKGDISANEKPDAFRLLNTLDKSLNSYTIDELSTFRNSIKDLQSLVKTRGTEGFKSPLLKKYFDEGARKTDGEKWTKNESGLKITEFFNDLTEGNRGVINLENFTKLLNNEKGEKSDLSMAYQEVVEKRTTPPADNIVDGITKEEWNKSRMG